MISSPLSGKSFGIGQANASSYYEPLHGLIGTWYDDTGAIETLAGPVLESSIYTVIDFKDYDSRQQDQSLFGTTGRQ